MRILIANPFGIGDVLFSTPLVACVRAALPRAYLAYLCNARTQELLAGSPHLDRVFVFEKDEYRNLWQRSRVAAIKRFVGFAQSIRRERFDLVLDLSLGDRYSLVLKLLGVSRRVGFDFRGRGRFLTQRIPLEGFHERHVVEYYLDLARLLGCRPQDQPLQFPVGNDAREWAQACLREHGLGDAARLVAVVPGGGASWGVEAVNKRWPAQHFARAADALIERSGVRVILLGHGTEDAALCAAVRGAMQHEAVDLCGRTSLAQFAALLARCELVLCNDGGPLHVAVSQGCRVVAMFGPVDDAVYGPYPRTRETAVVAQQLPCRPCYRSFRMPPCPYDLKCLRTLDIERVLAAAAERLAPSRN